MRLILVGIFAGISWGLSVELEMDAGIFMIWDS